MAIKKNSSIGENIFDVTIHAVLVILGVVWLYPLVYVLFASFSDPGQFIMFQGILTHPLGFSLVGYQVVFKNPNIYIGYFNTMFYMVVGTALNVIMTAFGAYALSRKDFLLRTPITKMLVFTMYFSGGLIPNFLLIRMLGMYDTRAAIIIPGAIAAYNLIVMRTSFAALGNELVESAKIDGANDFTILFRIVFPLAKATIAVVLMWYAVGHYNAWLNAMIYLQDRSKFPLQLFMREILISNSTSGNVVPDSSYDQVDAIIKYCTILVGTIPILCVFPFLQRYFVKGVMLGSLKG